VRMAGNFGSIRNPRLPAHMRVISSRSSMTGLSSHRARRRRSGIGVRVASPLIVNHHQKRASSLVSPAGSSSVMEATRPGARIAWFMAIHMPAHLDPELEALTLLTMSAGLGTSVIGGQSSAGQAQAVIDYHLYRLFPGSRPRCTESP
jgi:hypothetical protein